MEKGTTRLADKIGIPATLELMAEEAVELAHACLKYARYIRNENPTPGHGCPDLTYRIEEEMADVYLCLRELRKAGNLVDNQEISDILDQKRKRMMERLGVNVESYSF